MLMEGVGWSAGAEVPGESWTERSNTLPCCEREHESFRSAELSQQKKTHLTILLLSKTQNHNYLSAVM